MKNILGNLFRAISRLGYEMPDGLLFGGWFLGGFFCIIALALCSLSDVIGEGTAWIIGIAFVTCNCIGIGLLSEALNKYRPQIYPEGRIDSGVLFSAALCFSGVALVTFMFYVVVFKTHHLFNWIFGKVIPRWLGEED